MAASIATAIERMKAGIAQWLLPDAIHQLCTDLCHDWRDRVLNPATTIHLFALQILHGNTGCTVILMKPTKHRMSEAFSTTMAQHLPQ